MELFGYKIEKKQSDGVSIDTVIQRLDAIHESLSGVSVTPDNCMQSPTVHALVTAISKRIATLPVHVIRKRRVNGKELKERQPGHPVARVLANPNSWQTKTTYFLDATSQLIRYGNFYAFKGRGRSGPLRRLVPLNPSQVTPEQNETSLEVMYRVTLQNGSQTLYQPSQIHHVRGLARDGIEGDSPVHDAKESIALEIAAERFGASFFGNGAQPSLVFKYIQGMQGHKTAEEQRAFIEDFHKAYSNRNRFKAMLLPKGVELEQPIAVNNEQSQFQQTRQYQRTVVAGAFGVPPHLVGDLSSGTFSNVEQQNLDFLYNVILPYVRLFESAMEKDLLTQEERDAGFIIRFNIDAQLRADFRTRQEGLNIMRQAGVISPNEWRDAENMNPISEENGGDSYYVQGPSGQEPSNNQEGNNNDEEQEEEDNNS